MQIDATMPDGSIYTIRKLLSKGKTNTKLNKSDKSDLGYLTYGLSLAAHKMSGYNVCPNASPGCIASCIVTSGFAGIFSSVNRSRIAKTRAWFQNREEFKKMLIYELKLAKKMGQKHGMKIAVRLNVFSDISWERIFPEIFRMFPDIQFYDYTKNYSRAIDSVTSPLFPLNYHLTFSRSEDNEKLCLLALRAGVNVAVVFDKKNIPLIWNGVAVVNGDETDLRFLDPQGGYVIGLYAKGKGRKDDTGFVVKTVEKHGRRIALSMV